MKRARTGWIVTFMLGWAQFAVAQTPQLDAQALTKDVQIMRQNAGGTRLVFWMPREYWDVSMSASVSSAEQRAKVLQRLEGYEIVSVLEGRMGMMGVFLGSSRDELIKKVSLQVGATTLKALPTAELPAQLQQFVQGIQPLLMQMTGQIGQNTHVLVFKGTDADGKRLLDPLQPGNFKVMLGEEVFAFRLPLGSMLPPLFDADSGERFPGNYLYSPYTGKKLVANQPSNQP